MKAIDPTSLVTVAEGAANLIREYQYLGTPLEIRTKIADLKAENYMLRTDAEKQKETIKRQSEVIRRLNIKLDKLEGRA